VLINLIMNAMQSLPDRKGDVLVSSRYDSGGREVVLEVQDNGSGIGPETMERLFEPFFSTKLDRGGSGLGLYISHYIVAEHGGRLSLSSQPGKGTLARVALPVKDASLVDGLAAAEGGEHPADPLHEVS